MVNFTLSENSGPFSIKSATGEICVARPLDYETRKLYEFPVVATDRGEWCFNINTLNVMLYIIINIVYDNFISCMYAAAIQIN